MVGSMAPPCENDRPRGLRAPEAVCDHFQVSKQRTGLTGLMACSRRAQCSQSKRPESRRVDWKNFLRSLPKGPGSFHGHQIDT